MACSQDVRGRLQATLTDYRARRSLSPTPTPTVVDSASTTTHPLNSATGAVILYDRCLIATDTVSTADGQGDEGTRDATSMVPAPRLLACRCCALSPCASRLAKKCIFGVADRSNGCDNGESCGAWMGDGGSTGWEKGGAMVKTSAAA